MGEFNDTQRLDFMLSQGRELVLEGMGTNGSGTFWYTLYVQEGRWGSQEHKRVHLEGPSNFEASPDQKRQAIDLAMEAQP